jgi:DNA polymerase-3 subunit delta'
MKIPALQDEELALALKERKGVGEEQARQIAYLSEGNYRKAIGLLSASTDDQNYARLFANWLRACYLGREQMPYWVETFVTGKHPIDGKKGEKTGRREHILFLQYGLFFLRELLVLKLSEDTSRLRLSTNEIKTAQGLVKILSVSQIDQLQQLFDDTIYFVERNANAKILFMGTSVQIHRIFKPLKKA